MVSLRAHTRRTSAAFSYIAAHFADQADAHALLEPGSIVAMSTVELELRFHELVHPAAQGDVWLTEQIGIDGVHQQPSAKLGTIHSADSIQKNLRPVLPKGRRAEMALFSPSLRTGV
jgi:hypothetical protein